MPFPVFDTKDQIPAGFEADYEERDAKWHPIVPDVANLKLALESEKDRAKKAEDARRIVEKKLGDKERAELAAGAGISEQKLQELRDEDARKRGEELTPLQQKLADAETRLRSYELTTPVQKAFAGAGMFPEEWDERSEKILKRFALSDAGKPVVLDDAGQVTTTTVEQYVAKYAADFPRAFGADVGSGGGAQRSAGGGAAAKTVEELAAKRRTENPMYQM